ncbi:GUN4 domain-containing protein [Cyanobium sp. LEGE 06143]|uniref:GUN4 domain-containing protein n=1 Tax=Cyanobium sp. LEGE 06143 TaxID=945727 RepID=UPI001882E7B5|nr:GUN4 domain-containing protein [Cyanobium sp. LEGE 06143]MBE9173094.1 GUN4 domain-containing protein [Cyanobium sp. LEGE 06143]
MLSGAPVSANVSPEDLLQRFQAATARQRRALLGPVQQRVAELRPLLADHLAGLDATGDDWAAGALIQLLLETPSAEAQAFLDLHPQGWLATSSATGIDYAPLQLQLARMAFEEADRLTSAILRELAGAAAVTRGYVYYSEVPAMPAPDLEALDRLWVCYSRGRFGFSVQGRLLQACQGRWEQLWPRLGWKQDGRWTRYPGSFAWSIDAPEGHMPLVNQLRGVRLMDALLNQPALQQRINR